MFIKTVFKPHCKCVTGFSVCSWITQQGENLKTFGHLTEDVHDLSRVWLIFIKLMKTV